MLDYYVRLTRQYKVPVIQVVIFLQETNEKEVFIEAYSSETTIHRYRVIRMWEQDSALFLNNPGLLPLAPLTRTNSPQSLLSQVSENVAKISDRETQQDIAAYTEILAGLRFEKNLIRQLLSEEIMQESVIYQDILQKGEQRTIIRLLNRRFGEIDSSLLNSIRMLTIEKLDDLADSLLDFSEISDLVTWLNRHEN
jgi:predicted transposase YdaD